jgi:hypothetical protein
MTNKFTDRLMEKLVLSLACIGLSACATGAPLPAYQLERSEASIRGAEEVGALNVPEARLHVQLAKDETETAKKMAGKGDERAVLVMARAESDAELALGLAREFTVHNDALKAAEDLKALHARSAP